MKSRANWRYLLRRDLPRTFLAQKPTRFTVFGLGDSSYPNYNTSGRRLWVRLQQLGAEPFFQRGLGDDQSTYGVIGDLESWLRGPKMTMDAETSAGTKPTESASASQNEEKKEQRIGLFQTLESFIPACNEKVDKLPPLLMPLPRRSVYILAAKETSCDWNTQSIADAISELESLHPYPWPIVPPDNARYVPQKSSTDNSIAAKDCFINKFVNSQRLNHQEQVEPGATASSASGNLPISVSDIVSAWKQECDMFPAPLSATVSQIGSLMSEYVPEPKGKEEDVGDTDSAAPNTGALLKGVDDQTGPAVNSAPANPISEAKTASDLHSVQHITLTWTLPPSTLDSVPSTPPSTSPSTLTSVPSTTKSPASLPPLHDAGDIAVLYPSNPPSVVDAMLQRLGLTGDEVLLIHPRTMVPSYSTLQAEPQEWSQATAPFSNPEHVQRFAYLPFSESHFHKAQRPLPSIVTARTLLARYLDIAGVPPRGALELLSLLIPPAQRKQDANEKNEQGEEEEEALEGEHREKLLEMTRSDGVDLFHTYCTRERRNWVELLEDFHTIPTIPLELLIEIIPPLLPRSYSIASLPYLRLPAADITTGATSGMASDLSTMVPLPSNLALLTPEAIEAIQTHSVSLDLCISLLKYHTFHGRYKEGVASSWISSWNEGETVYLWTHAGSFSLEKFYKPMPNGLSTTTTNTTNTTTTTTPTLASPQEQSQPQQASPKMLSAPPLILIGPGTGFAPMRSILHATIVSNRLHAEYKHQDDPSSPNLTPESNSRRLWSFPSPLECLPQFGTALPPQHRVYVFFGCRYQRRDWLYYSEMCDLLLPGSDPHTQSPSPSHSHPHAQTRLRPYSAFAAECRPHPDYNPLKRYSAAFSRDRLGLAYVPSPATGSATATTKSATDPASNTDATSVIEAETPLAPAAAPVPTLTPSLSLVSPPPPAPGLPSAPLYVQDMITVQANSLRRLLVEEGAVVFISGAAGKMPADVQAALETVLSVSDVNAHNKESELGDPKLGKSTMPPLLVGGKRVDAKMYINAMKASGRLVIEAW